MDTTNHARKEAHYSKNSFSYVDSHSSPNQMCCPYFNYCFNIYHQMYYKSSKIDREYNEQTSTSRNFIKTYREYDTQTDDTPDFVEVEDLKPTSPNIYKFKNNFNVYLQKTKRHA